MERFADIVIRFRWPIFIVIALLTIFFGWQATYVKFHTAISDLWPTDHPFIKVYHAYEYNYGSPLTAYVMVRVKKGTIYNPETLEKIARITREIDAIPGVNHDQVVSIASRKVKTITLKGSDIRVDNLFPRDIPRTERELARFQDDVAAAGVIGTLVSFDGTASLISGNFIEKRTDIQQVFQRLQEIENREQDKNHEIYLAGEPILKGWVRAYQQETLTIVIITLTLMFFLLYIYIRSVRLTLLPILATLVSTIWGVGFAGLLRYTLDPLILIIPALLMARTLSHGVQKVERIIELEEHELDVYAKAKALILALFGSGMLGIITDALGILVISMTSIPLMRQLAIFCSFWAASNIFSVLILIPVVVSLVGIPAGRQIMQRLEESSITGILKGLGWLVTGRRARWVTAGFIIISLSSFIISSRIKIGDVHPGTALLWPESPFNTAVKNINHAFVGTDEFYVIIRPRQTDEKSLKGMEAASSPTGEVIKGKKGEETASVSTSRNPWAVAPGSEERGGATVTGIIPTGGGIVQVPVLRQMQDFQEYMERHPLVRKTFSYADFLPVVSRRLHGNHVKWEFLPEINVEAAQFAHLLLRGTDPGDFNRFVNDKHEHASIIIWLQDHRGETLEKVVKWIRGYLDQHKESGAAEFQLASGFAGVVAAINDEVAKKEFLFFVLAVTVVGVACMITFRSFLAAIILMIPLIVTNFVVMSIMVFMEIGLDVNTLPIVSIGMGVGIDYGIYLLTRILQEYRRKGDYADAIPLAIRTTGRAIFFTASIMVFSVGIWYFLSSFRFMAEMGFLLALVMGVNMLGALLVIPATIMVMKPRFALTARLLVWD